MAVDNKVLERMRRLHDKGTTGEWITFANRLYRSRSRNPEDDERIMSHNDHLMDSRDEACWFIEGRDAELVCLMHNHLADILDELERFRKASS